MDASAVWTALLGFVGVWRGSGQGTYPTLESFAYRERLEITDAGPRSLHYRQDTWRRVGERDVDSHIETGFLNVNDAGQILVLNAQGSDRVEVLRGTLSEDMGVATLDLASMALAFDDRMVRSWRSIRLAGDVLSYTMGMATTAVPDGAIHLVAQLNRRP